MFEETVGASSCGSRLKLNLLLKSTIGAARDANSKYTLMEAEQGYKQAKQKLEERFGSPYLVSSAIIEDIQSGKPAKTPAELLKLSDKLENAELILNDMNMYSELDTQASILNICKLLPNHLTYKWRDCAMKIKSSTMRYPNFSQFASYVKDAATSASDPVYGQINYSRATNNQKVSQHVSSYSTSFKQSKTPEREYVVCQGHHRLFYCETFKSLSVQDRIGVVKRHNLCENCLLGNHNVDSCFKTSICSVPGCGKKHTKFLHDESVQGNNRISTVINNSVNVMTNSVLMPIVPIIVNDSYATYALLDTGSNSSFCTKRLMDKLDVCGKIIDYELNTLHGVNSTRSQSVKFNVMSQERSECLSMSNVLVIDDIPVDMPLVDMTKYSHLEGLSSHSDVVVNVLIGQDHAAALRPLDTRSGKKDEPFATLTLLGWCLNGPVRADATNRRIITNFISTAKLDRDIHILWHIEDEEVGSKDITFTIPYRKGTHNVAHTMEAT